MHASSPCIYYSGGYTISLVVTSNGCSDSLTRPGIITVYPTPVAGFTANPWETDILQPRINFFNTSQGDSTRYWNFGAGTYDNTGTQNPIHTYEDSGRYTVCLAVYNPYGCKDSVCHDIIIRPVWSFYIPNAFSPNGDGFNEGFIGKSWNVIQHQMWIFDRWGNMIFTTNQTKDPESAVPWDGRANGGADPAQEDVYVWVVIIKDIHGKVHKLIGHVTLVK